MYQICSEEEWSHPVKRIEPTAMREVIGLMVGQPIYQKRGNKESFQWNI